MDGIRGYARLKEERFDLILTDIRMPEISGFEILAAARMHAPGTPVIAMSGSAEIPDAVRAMHAGARDFLIKPFEVRTLEEAVAAVLKPVPPNEPETDALAWRDEHAPSSLSVLVWTDVSCQMRHTESAEESCIDDQTRTWRHS